MQPEGKPDCLSRNSASARATSGAASEFCGVKPGRNATRWTETVANLTKSEDFLVGDSVHGTLFSDVNLDRATTAYEFLSLLRLRAVNTCLPRSAPCWTQ